MGGPFSPIINTGDGWINKAIGALQDQMRELIAATARIFGFDYTQVDLADFPLPVNWTEYVVTNVQVPAGFSQAVVLCFASAGVTFQGTGSGVVGVQPTVQYSGGPGISNGSPGASPVSVSSFMARLVDGLSAGDSVRLSVYACANANGMTQNAGSTGNGSGNVHLSAAVLFRR